jgi:hypothetical protein
MDVWRSWRGARRLSKMSNKWAAVVFVVILDWADETIAGQSTCLDAKFT